MANGERREGVQLRIKTRRITIFREGKAGDVAPLVLILDVVVVGGVIVAVVVVNDNNISVIFRTTTTTIPCQTVCNAALPHPSNYIPPVPLNQITSTLIDQFHSITPITFYHTRFALLHSSHTTLDILFYPVHLTLPHPKYKNKQKIQTRTKIKTPSSTTSTRYAIVLT